MIFILNGRGSAPWLILLLFFASSFFVSLFSVDEGDIKEASLLHRYSTIQTSSNYDSISSKIFKNFRKNQKNEFTAPWLKNNVNWKTIITKTTNHSILVSVVYFNEKSTIEQFEIETSPFLNGLASNDVWIFKRKIDINGTIDFVQTSRNVSCLNVIYSQYLNEGIERFLEIFCEKEDFKFKFPGNSEIASVQQMEENTDCFFYSRVNDKFKFRILCNNESFTGPMSTDSSYLISLQQQDKDTLYGLNLIPHIEYDIHKYQIEIISFTKKKDNFEYGTVTYRRKAFIDLHSTKMNIVQKSNELITICPFDRYILIIEKSKATLFDFSPHHDSYHLSKYLKSSIDEDSKYISIINGYRSIYIIQKQGKWIFKRAIFRKLTETIIDSVFVKVENKTILMVIYKDGSIASFDIGDSNIVATYILSKWKVLVAIVGVISVYIWNELNIRRRQQNTVPPPTPQTY